MGAIPHPLVPDTLARLQGSGLEGRVVLVHLNHRWGGGGGGGGQAS
jgi:hypothetical protein